MSSQPSIFIEWLGRLDDHVDSQATRLARASDRATHAFRQVDVDAFIADKPLVAVTCAEGAET